jgi:hypothetical protein
MARLRGFGVHVLAAARSVAGVAMHDTTISGDLGGVWDARRRANCNGLRRGSSVDGCVGPRRTSWRLASMREEDGWMGERVTIRLDDDLRSRLSDVAKARGMNLSSVVRQAVMPYMESPKARASVTPDASSAIHVHDVDMCAQTLLEGCLPEVQQVLLTGAQTMDCSLVDLVHAALIVAAWSEGQPRPQLPWQRTPAHTPEDCARVLLEHCSPAVQARMADAMARLRVPLMRLLLIILQYWTDAARNPRASTSGR